MRIDLISPWQRIELADRRAAEQHGAVPCGPEGHVGAPEPGEIEHMRAARRGIGADVVEVHPQQCDHRGVFEPPFADLHHRARLPSGAAGRSIVVPMAASPKALIGHPYRANRACRRPPRKIGAARQRCHVCVGL
ncbi:MAG: hypothetical protein WDN24_05900 [Sphingomonas sp.]